MTNKLPGECDHGMPVGFYCDACTIDRLNVTIRTQHALLVQARDALRTGTNWMTHGDLLAAINQHLDKP